MAGDEPRENMIRVKTTYTFNEAIDYMKMKPNKKIHWYNAKTGKEVFIGYTT